MDKQSAISQLEAVMHEYEVWKGAWNKSSAVGRQTSPDLRLGLHACNVRLRATLNRLAPPGSPYVAALQSVSLDGLEEISRLAGSVTALLADYRADCLVTYRELINAELYSDFLSMAEHLLREQSLKEPAAVIAGSVLEEQLRKLCDKNKIDTKITKDGKQLPKKPTVINAELKKASVYNLNEHKQVEAWLGIRNSAAHGKYDEFDEMQVSVMIRGLREFLSRFPA